MSVNLWDLIMVRFGLPVTVSNDPHTGLPPAFSDYLKFQFKHHLTFVICGKSIAKRQPASWERLLRNSAFTGTSCDCYRSIGIICLTLLKVLAAACRRHCSPPVVSVLFCIHTVGILFASVHGYEWIRERERDKMKSESSDWPLIGDLSANALFVTVTSRMCAFSVCLCLSAKWWWR